MELGDDVPANAPTDIPGLSMDDMTQQIQSIKQRLVELHNVVPFAPQALHFDVPYAPQEPAAPPGSPEPGEYLPYRPEDAIPEVDMYEVPQTAEVINLISDDSTDDEWMGNAGNA